MNVIYKSSRCIVITCIWTCHEELSFLLGHNALLFGFRTKCEDSKRWIIFKAVHQTYVRECAQNKTLVTPCIENSDFVRAERFGTCGTVLTVEGGAVLGGNLENIPYLASCGVRMLTLTWNGTCEFGDGAMVTHPKGLTKFGRKAIPKLEQQRIVVDISHASEPLFLRCS